MFWEYVAVYLSVGIVWSSFAAYKQARLYQEAPPYKAAIVVALNASLWPIAILLGASRFITETE